MTLTALIPARGGSKRVAQKNLAPVAGVPLVVRAIDFCRQFTDDVVVSTDSTTIFDLARQHGAKAVHRSTLLSSDDATIDSVVAEWLDDNPEPGLLVYQPTVVGVSPATVKQLLSSALPTALATFTHGIWSSIDNQVDARINSQFLEGGPYREVGVRYYPPGPIRAISSPIEVLPTDDEIIDIDTPFDLYTANAIESRADILIRYVTGPEIGTGHRRRALALAHRLQHHNVTLHEVNDGRSPSSRQHVDLILNDTLDTSEAEMAQLRSLAPVITFEDLGSGARLANEVINDLYPLYGQHGGHRYSILRPEFLGHHPIPIADRSSILVTFGGTDPNNLTHRLHYMLGDKAVYMQPPSSHIQHPFAQSDGFAYALANARFVFTSAGRTVYEAAALGTPAFVIAQNAREATHAHLGMEYGNYFLGHHDFVDDADIYAVLRITNDTLQQMSDRAFESMDGKGLDRVLALIESTLLEHR